MRILVTGTGFGVGKTWVACELARAIQDAGRQVVIASDRPPTDLESLVIPA